MNLPNLLTLSRIIMIPVFVVIFYLPVQWSYFVSATIFALAAATDWLDGYLARRLDQSTPFGAFLDPVADAHIPQPRFAQSNIEVIKDQIMQCLRQTCLTIPLEPRQNQIGMQANHFIAAQHRIRHAKVSVKHRDTRLLNNQLMQLQCLFPSRLAVTNST